MNFVLRFTNRTISLRLNLELDFSKKTRIEIILTIWTLTLSPKAGDLIQVCQFLSIVQLDHNNLNKILEPTPAPSVSKLSYNPNKLDLDAWNSNNNNQQLYDQHSSSYSVSKDGVQSLKAKLYQPLSPSPAPAGQFSSSSSPNFNQQQRPTHNQSTSRIKLVSQENYLFNSKNAQSQLNPHDVAHDNSHNESNYGKDRYYDGGSFNDYGAYSHSSFNEQVASSDL